MVAVAPKRFLLDDETAINLVAWRSSRLTRVARSSLAAETQALSEGEQELMWVRLQMAELEGVEVDPKDAWKAVASIPGLCVINAKALHDAIQKSREGGVVTIKEKSSALELLGLIDSLKQGFTTVRWVHSESQIADALTKHTALSRGALARFMQ